MHRPHWQRDSSIQIGDKAAIEELHRHGAIYHHIVMDVDPVPGIRRSRGKSFMERDSEHTLEVSHMCKSPGIYIRMVPEYTGRSFMPCVTE